MEKLYSDAIKDILSDPIAISVLMIELGILLTIFLLLLNLKANKPIFLNAGTIGAFSFETTSLKWNMECLSLQRYGLLFYLSLAYALTEGFFVGINSATFYFFGSVTITVFLVGLFKKPEVIFSSVGFMIFDPIGGFTKVTRRGGVVWKSINSIQYVQHRHLLRVNTNAGNKFECIVTPKELTFLEIALTNNEVDITIEKK